MGDSDRYTIVLSGTSTQMGGQTRGGVNQIVVEGPELTFATEAGSLHVRDSYALLYLLAPGSWQEVRRNR